MAAVVTMARIRICRASFSCLRASARPEPHRILHRTEPRRQRLADRTADGTRCARWHQHTELRRSARKRRTYGKQHRRRHARLEVKPQLGVFGRDDLEHGLRHAADKLAPGVSAGAIHARTCERAHLAEDEERVRAALGEALRGACVAEPGRDEQPERGEIALCAPGSLLVSGCMYWAADGRVPSCGCRRGA
jgi:hypothetical protein